MVSLGLIPIQSRLCRLLQLRPSTTSGVLPSNMAAGSVVGLIGAASFPLARLHSCILPARVSPIQPPFAIESALPIEMHRRGWSHVLAATPGICWALCMRGLMSAIKGVAACQGLQEGQISPG